MALRNTIQKIYRVKPMAGMNGLIGRMIPAAMVLPTIALLPGGGSLNANADEYWEQRVSLFDTLPSSHHDIIFLGNSITDGSEFAEYFRNPDIKNRGIRSDVIDGVRKRLTQVTRGVPDKIFLLIGINDVSHKLSSRTLAVKYETLVREIREQTPTTCLYLQGLMPINNSFGRYKNLAGTEGTIRAFNDSIKKIAERNQAVYIDLTEALSDSKGNLRRGFTNDGLHLNGSGYAAWGEVIAPYIGPSRIDTNPNER